MRLPSLCILCLPLLPGAALGHELWLAPVAHEVAADGMVVADIVNGQAFDGPRFAYLPNRVARYVVALGAQEAPVEMRIGDRPALNVPPLGEGLHLIGYQSTPATLVYDDFDAFARFAAHKDLGDVAAAHAARALPEAGFAEAYTRFSKTLIAVGDGAGADRALGFETEFVARDNPYRADWPVAVQLLQDGQPRGDAQVEVFLRAPDGTVTITLLRTDAEGMAQIDAPPGSAVMLDAVILREPSAALAEETGAVWETLWANLTFARP